MSKLSVILSLIALSALLPACVAGTDQKPNTRPPGSANAADQNTAPHTNVEELGLLVRVPYEAEDVVWKESPSGKKVTAVLLFSKETAERVVADAQAHGAGQPVTISPEIWFPDELIAQGEMSGDAAIRGMAYPANDFFHDKYNTGRIIHIEGGDHFVLEVSAQ